MIRYRLLIFGLFFLFNPYFWVIDILPDFIGFLLISKAIKPIIDASPSAESAMTYLRRASEASIAQLAFLIPMISFVNSDPTFNMVFAFTFNFLKLLFVIPALHELFNSLYYFADKHAQPKTLMRSLKLGTMLFFLVHAVLSCFPEIVFLKVDDSGLAEETIYPLMYYRTGIIFLCALIALIVGIIWLVFSIAGFLNLRKNSILNEGISLDVANAERPLKKTVMRSLKPAIFCLTLSGFCAISYFIDGKSAIPPYILPVIHIFAITFMRRLSDKKVTRAFSIVATVLGAFLYLAYEMFSAVSHDRALFAFEDVKTQFYLPYCINVLYTAFIILSTICLGIAFYRIIERHTGLFWENAFITHNSKAAKEKLHQKQTCFLLTVLLCAAAAFNTFSYRYLYIKPKLNLIATLVSLAIAFIGTYLYSNVRISVIEKYSTENKTN